MGSKIITLTQTPKLRVAKIKGSTIVYLPLTTVNHSGGCTTSVLGECHHTLLFATQITSSYQMVATSL